MAKHKYIPLLEANLGKEAHLGKTLGGLKYKIKGNRSVVVAPTEDGGVYIKTSRLDLDRNVAVLEFTLSLGAAAAVAHGIERYLEVGKTWGNLLKDKEVKP